jgi:hypothetical protein
MVQPPCRPEIARRVAEKCAECRGFLARSRGNGDGRWQKCSGVSCKETWAYPVSVGSQEHKQAGRKHDIAVFAALTLFDAHDHTLALDVGDLEDDDSRH